MGVAWAPAPGWGSRLVLCAVRAPPMTCKIITMPMPMVNNMHVNAVRNSVCLCMHDTPTPHEHIL